MTGILIGIKHRCPELWKAVEWLNGHLVRLRYPKLHEIADSIIKRNLTQAPATDSVNHTDSDNNIDRLRWQTLSPEELPALSDFLRSLPSSSLTHFRPHPFDPGNLRRLHRSGSLLMIGVWKGKVLTGYHFLRCFANGKCFHGLVVSPESRGLGTGTRMWSIGAEIASRAGMEMYATISEDNPSSLASCHRGCDAKLIKNLPQGYLLIRCNPKNVKINC